MFKSIVDKNKPNLIFIHGWAGSWQYWHPILERLKDQYNLYAPNLPYPTDTVLTLEDYTQFILTLIKEENIVSPILIGHSLGGAIATKIAAEHPEVASAIVLASSASIRHELPQPWKLLQKFAKPLKPFREKILKLTHLDASDYLTLKTEIEKDTFRNLIHTDLTAILPSIKCPTLILWGDNDTSTPKVDGLKIHSLIPQSKFFSFPNADHFFFLDHPDVTVTQITDFLINDLK